MRADYFQRSGHIALRIAAGQVLAKLSDDTHPVALRAWGKRCKVLLIAISDLTSYMWPVKALLEQEVVEVFQ